MIIFWHSFRLQKLISWLFAEPLNSGGSVLRLGQYVMNNAEGSTLILGFVSIQLLVIRWTLSCAMNEGEHWILVRRKGNICSCSKAVSEQIELVLITVIVMPHGAPFQGQRSLLAVMKVHIPMFFCYLKHFSNQKDKSSCSSVWKGSKVSITTLLLPLISAVPAGSLLMFLSCQQSAQALPLTPCCLAMITLLLFTNKCLWNWDDKRGVQGSTLIANCTCYPWSNFTTRKWVALIIETGILSQTITISLYSVLRGSI